MMFTLCLNKNFSNLLLENSALISASCIKIALRPYTEFIKLVANLALISVEGSGPSEINNINNVSKNKSQGNRKCGLHFCI